jgi:hypothetical protein
VLNTRCCKKIVLLLVFFFIDSLPVVSAHEGHSHEAMITIGKKTVVHLQTILSAYQDVHTHLVKKDLDGISGLAQKMSDAARQAILTESNGAGRHMMEHVLAGAEDLQKAKNIQDAQKSFASISEGLLPFFKSWPNQLKRNELKICKCKHDGYCWLQSQNCASACPHNADQTKVCTEIEEIR